MANRPYKSVQTSNLSELLSNKDVETVISNDLIMQEYAQAWDQLRHLENVRFRCFALAFSISLVAIGVLGALITKLEGNSNAILILCFSISSVVGYACYILGDMASSIRAFMHFHGGTISEIRKYFLGDEIRDELSARPYVNAIMKGRIQFGDAVLMLTRFLVAMYILLSIFFFVWFLRAHQFYDQIP